MTANLREPSTGGVGGTVECGDCAYTHTQDAPSTLWLVGHNLGFFPGVTVVDTMQREVEADVQHVDANNLTVAFSVIATGQVFLS